MKPRFKFGFVAVGLLLGGFGCDWRKLDDAVEKAPVVAGEAPGGYAAEDVGRLIVPLPYDPATPLVIGRFVFFGQTRSSIGVAEFDVAGKVTVHAAPDTALAPLNAESVTSAAWVGLGAGDLLLGTVGAGGAADTGATFLLKITFVPGGKPTFAITQHVATIPATLPTVGASTPDKFWGAGIAVGEVTGDAFPDQIVMSRDHVVVLESGQTDFGAKPFATTESNLCTVALDELNIGDGRVKLPRPLTTLDLVAGGASEILVGLPRGLPPQKGAVRIMRRVPKDPTNPVAFTLDCPVELVAAPDATPESAAGFGSSVAPLDLDGDGKDESVLVGSPPDRAYVVKGPVAVDETLNRNLHLGVPAQFAVLPPVPAANFGLRVTAFDLDGQPGDEIIVSAPDMPDGSKVSAGQVFIFKWDPATNKAIYRSSVKDNQSESLAMLGYDVAGMPFVTPPCAKTGAPARQGTLLIAGTRSEVFTYFRTPIVPPFTEVPDPRCN